MSFGGLFDSGGSGGLLSGGGGGGGAISQPPRSLPHKPTIFSSPALSLALQTNMEGQGDRNSLAVVTNVGGRVLDSAQGANREEENESRSGSDHLDAVSADDMEPDPNPRKRKKRYHRHTPQQIQELETLFKECPHPDEKQRLELSKRLCLESRQVKFWFQNRRTQMKTQMERHENTILRQENDKLRAENLAIREAMRNPICSSCGGPAVLGEISLEEQHLRIENARLKDELDRVCALAGKFMGKPAPAVGAPLPLPMPNSSLELAVGTNAYAALGAVPAAALPALTDFPTTVSSPLGTVITPARTAGGGIVGVDKSLERSLLLELALAAMDELVKMAQMEEPLWIPSLEGGRDTVNYEEYSRAFPQCVGVKPVGFVSEASRETGIVIISSAALVETLMDAARWLEMFPSMIARASTTEVISGGMGGSRNGALQLMHAELQVLSPLVPIREINFLRFCKQLAEGAWAVADVSVDAIRENHSNPTANMKCRRLPSGCVVQDMPNGYCKVTWVEHAEYDEAAVHQLYRPLLRSGLALGAPRWLAILQRQCEGLAILMSSPGPNLDTATITAGGRRSMLKLAQRMTDNFCAGVSASSAHKWTKLVGAAAVAAAGRGGGGGAMGVEEEVRVMTRQSVDDPGEPPGVVLSAATSVWVPAVPPHRLFDFLRDERLRSQWDILSNGGPMHQMAHIPKGHHHGNAVSLLRAAAASANQSSMLILQETCTDASGSMVVYAPVDIPAMHLLMNGGDAAYVALLPSGFAILPDANRSSPGSLLTVAFQILVNSQPTAKLTVESVETVNNLISCTIKKIKAALHCDTT
ncbi:homeobox-leucine zipper protein ROC5-like [Ananas comosus]|uniref:Homeobox-leucine zipper protein ROC5-like n=1 Tax=Ananas comosus TaxID=4615 RepID=A0A6P5EU42_ANACO|nr:homeobox-leucine zipper protein ROC5-like [Ananas comosus]